MEVPATSIAFETCAMTANVNVMKRKKAQVGKASAGTIVGAKMRAECNRLTEGEREKLGEEFLKLYYGGNHKPATTRRR